MHKRISRTLLGLLAALLLSLAFGWASPLATSRVVAIADIHGDFDALVGILQRTSLVDSNRHWSGRNTIFVQLGDIVDRGPKTRPALDLLMELQKEAPKQGGKEIVLLGNHEAMNIYGDLRYVTPDDFASYADDKSERRRQAAYEAYVALGDAVPQVSQEQWIKAHPLGFIEHREAMGSGGKYGKWFRTLPAIVKVNDSIFLHGGLNPQLATWKLEQINEMIANEIKGFDAYQKFMVDEKIALPFFTLAELDYAAKAALKKSPDANRKKMLDGFLGYAGWMSIHPDGPLWFRGFAEWSDAEGATQIGRLIEAFGVKRFVVGHTPQAGQIVPRFDGRVYLIDTGMLSSYFPNGRASALEIQDGKATPIYP